ncbi:MAG: MiaB/RimO family radical SAM methylthiotransferase [candidate division WOR-3 bacterium]
MPALWIMSRACVITIGCRLNQYYSQMIREMLGKAGYEISGSDPDLVIINACAVTGRAERDTRKAARKALASSERVIVTGCPGESIRALGFQAMTYEELARELGIKNPEGISGFSGRARAYLRVQAGCDLSCAYCVVPRMRGPSVSRSTEEIIREAERLAGAGFKELVITGTQIGDWRDGNRGLAWLLGELLERIPGVRFRLSSVEPQYLNEELIGVMANAGWRVADHLHLPLQSGSDKVLSEMRRPYTLREYEEKALLALSAMPNLAIGTDVIVGFPTETESDFQNTLSFLRDFPLAYAHIFSYSKRPGTKAYHLGELDSRTLKMRVKTLLETDRTKRLEFSERFVGEELVVIGEKRVGDATLATSGNYLRMRVKGLTPGHLARVRMVSLGKGELVGRASCPPQNLEKNICQR